MRFCLASTLKRSKTETFIDKNDGFQKRSPKWGLMKTEVYRFGVDSKNGAFRKR